jgi:hypothetical protein
VPSAPIAKWAISRQRVRYLPEIVARSEWNALVRQQTPRHSFNELLDVESRILHLTFTKENVGGLAGTIGQHERSYRP